MDLVSLRKGLAGSPCLGVLEARGPRGYLEISSVASKLLVAWYYIQQTTETENSSSLVEQDVPRESSIQLVLAGCQFLSYRGGVCYLLIVTHI